MASATATQTVAQTSARSHLPFLLGVAILARVGLAIDYYHATPVRPLTELHDEDIAIALRLYGGHGFSSPFSFDSGPTAFLTPGYPLLISGAMRLLGTGRVAFLGLITFQVLLSIATVVLVWYVARRHFGIRTGNLAGLICAISEPMLLAPMYIWDTCLSALLLTAAVAFAPQIRSKADFAWAGIGCALATLVNPALLLTLLAIYAWSAWRARIIPWLGMLAFLIALAPWPIRNAIVMHSFIPLRPNFGYELWLGNKPGADGDTRQIDRPTFSNRERQLYLMLGELGYMREKGTLAKAWIAEHPREFASLTARRFARFWIGSSKSPTAMTVALTTLGLLGLGLLWRSRQLFILFALPLVLYPLPYYITHADVRYQFVIDPLLAILAGYACERFLAWTARRPAPTVNLAPIAH